MDFAVEVVPDGELPEGINQVMVERTGDVPLLILTESVAGVWAFVCDWADGAATEDPCPAASLLRAV